MGKAAANLTIFQKEKLGEKTCEVCKRPYEIFEMVMPDRKTGKLMKKKYDYCLSCFKANEDRKLAQDILEENEKTKLKNLQKDFSSFSFINPKLRNASFDNFIEYTQMESEGLQTAKRYLEVFSLEEPKNLLFWGSYGTGKSHLSKSICDEVIRKGHTAIFVNIPMMSKSIRATYNKDSQYQEHEIFARFEKADLLVLDDLGTGNHTDWLVHDVLFPILDARQGMNTVFTTNLNPNIPMIEDNPNKIQGLESMIGPRNFSRVMDNANIQTMIGKDKRKA